MHQSSFVWALPLRHIEGVVIRIKLQEKVFMYYVSRLVSISVIKRMLEKGILFQLSSLKVFLRLLFENFLLKYLVCTLQCLGCEVGVLLLVLWLSK